MNSLRECYNELARYVPHIEAGICDPRRPCKDAPCVIVSLRSCSTTKGKSSMRFKVRIHPSVGVQCLGPLSDLLKDHVDVVVTKDLQGPEPVTVEGLFRGRAIRPDHCTQLLRLEVAEKRLEDIVGKGLWGHHVCEVHFLPSNGGSGGKKRKAPVMENICAVISGFDGLKSQVEHNKTEFGILANCTFDKKREVISFRGARDPMDVCKYNHKYMRNPGGAKVNPNMVVMVGWKMNGNCTGTLLDESLAYSLGDSCVDIMVKTDSSINLTKFVILDWDAVWEKVKDGYFLKNVNHESRPRSGDLQGNKVTASYTGSIMVQFHFDGNGPSVVWTPELHAMLDIAARMATQLVCDHSAGM